MPTQLKYNYSQSSFETTKQNIKHNLESIQMKILFCYSVIDALLHRCVLIKDVRGL